MNDDQHHSRQPANDERLIMQLAAEVGKLAAAGVADATEQVLKSNADIDVDDELIMSLLYEEIVTAEQLNCGGISEDNYIQRFPRLRERISRLIAFHQTLSSPDDPLGNDRPHIHQQTIETGSTLHGFETVDTPDFQAWPPQRGEFDQFDIEEKIGQGGMGVVYRARQKNLNRQVALKLLRNPIVDSLQHSRLMNEAKAVARLQHPGIVQIHYVGETTEQPYLCFEYVDGVHLDERLQSSTMAADDACRLLKKIANAVSYAHQHGIVHRDLKPANILMDADGEPKVADFGLAKFQYPENDQEGAERLTQTGAVLGTICYMAPEQFTGHQRVDHRTDIYGLGAIFYEMLVGRPPQMGDTPDETMYQVTTEDPVPPRKLNPKIPRDVETICLKCLEKEPDDRFQTCSQLEQELQRYLNGDSLSIRPTSRVTVAVRWCQRRPAIAMLSALSALLLLVLTIGGYLMAWNQAQHAYELQRQRDLSRESAELAAKKAEEAEAASQFMINALGSAHPERDGRNVTVVERLDDGLREIEESYPDDSATKAALLTAIGKTYKGLGLHKDSMHPLKRAWEIYGDLNGQESIEALTAETEYADVLFTLGRHEQAEQRLLHAREALVSTLGADASPSIRASTILAQNEFRQGRREQAFDEFADVYQRARNHLSLTDRTTIATVLAYADRLKEVGRIQESRQLVTELLQPAIAEYGAESLLVLDLQRAMASIDRAEGSYAQALERFQQIHRIRAKKFGHDHIKTLISLNGVAICHADMGNYSEAIAVFTDIMIRMAETMGQFHPQTLRSVVNVARTLESLDRHPESLDLLKTTYDRAAAALGHEHTDTMMMAAHYGRKLAEGNQLHEAEELLTQAVDYFREHEHAEPFIRGEPFIQLGNLYKRTDRMDQAIELYQQVLEMSQDAFGDSNPATLTAKNNLAGAFFQAYHMDQAIEMYQEVLGDLQRFVGDDNPRTLATALNLAIAYRDDGRAQDAIDVLLAIVPVLQDKAQGSWRTSTAEFQLGRAYLDNQQMDAADRYLETAYAGFNRLVDQQPASQRIGLANQISTIVEQFKTLNRTDTANTWQQRRNQLLDE